MGSTRRASLLARHCAPLAALVGVVVLPAGGLFGGAGSAGSAGSTVPPSVWWPIEPVPDELPGSERLYPRRPGAKFGDLELAPGARWRLPGGRARLDAVGVVDGPVGGLEPAYADLYTTRGLLEAFSPRIDGGDATSTFLRVDLVATFNLESAACIATSAADGAVALPHRAALSDRAGNEPGRRAWRVVFYFPIGERRGTFYVTCETLAETDSPLGFGLFRAVWRVDT